jgi:hypothetical protein
MASHKTERLGQHRARPPRLRDVTPEIPSAASDITVTMPATITAGPFASKKQMLDFIASASEGISLRLPDQPVIKIVI